MAKDDSSGSEPSRSSGSGAPSGPPGSGSSGPTGPSGSSNSSGSIGSTMAAYAKAARAVTAYVVDNSNNSMPPRGLIQKNVRPLVSSAASTTSRAAHGAVALVGAPYAQHSSKTPRAARLPLVRLRRAAIPTGRKEVGPMGGLADRHLGPLRLTSDGRFCARFV